MCCAQAPATIKATWKIKCKFCQQRLPSAEVATLHQTYCSSNPAMFDAADLPGRKAKKVRRQAGMSTIPARRSAMAQCTAIHSEPSVAVGRDAIKERVRRQKQRRFWKKGEDEDLRPYLAEAARKAETDKWLKSRRTPSGDKPTLATPPTPFTTLVADERSPSRTIKARPSAFRCQHCIEPYITKKDAWRCEQHCHHSIQPHPLVLPKPVAVSSLPAPGPGA